MIFATPKAREERTVFGGQEIAIEQRSDFLQPFDHHYTLLGEAVCLMLVEVVADIRRDHTLKNRQRPQAVFPNLPFAELRETAAGILLPVEELSLVWFQEQLPFGLLLPRFQVFQFRILRFLPDRPLGLDAENVKHPASSPAISKLYFYLLSVAPP